MLAECLDNAVKKEQEIPNIILKVLNILKGDSFVFENENKKMRSSEEIKKDYGLM